MTGATDEYARLAALFTTDDPTVDMSPSAEFLLPAHLPVQGGLWLVPYALRESLQGMAVLLRMHKDTVDVAIVGQGEACLEGARSIEDVLEAVSGRASHWIVQPPHDAEPSALVACDVDRLTLLSGADQAAVVGAYRVLKGLAAASEGVIPMPKLRLVVVGAEDRSATDAASRIVQTAHHQLSLSVEVGPPLPAMGSSGSVIAEASLPRTSGVEDLLSRLRGATIGQSEPAPAPVPAEAAPSLTESMPATSPPRPPAPVPAAPQLVQDQPESTVPEPPVHPDPVAAPKPPAPPEPAVPAVAEAPAMAAAVEGLLALAVRCPEHDHIELALDASGGLHVLADARDMRDAAIVVGWARRHRDLIAMACSAANFDVDRDPLQHLFTDDAVAVADLQGGDLKLHLRTMVEVEGHSGWYTTPLN